MILLDIPIREIVYVIQLVNGNISWCNSMQAKARYNKLAVVAEEQ